MELVYTNSGRAWLVSRWLQHATLTRKFSQTIPLEDTIRDYHDWYGYDVTDEEMEEMLQ